MNAIESIESFWNALPEANPFKYQFEMEIEDMKRAERDIAQAEAELRQARERYVEAYETLNRYVNNAAKKDWSTEQIAQAKKEGGAL